MKGVRAYMSAAGLLVGTALAGVAQADDAIDAWARWAMTPKVWKGPIVRTPEPSARPAHDGVVESLELPLRVYASGRSRRSMVEATATLGSLERAYDRWSASGWPLPEALDLYVSPAFEESRAAVDRLVSPSDFDAAQTFALAPLEPAAPERDACVQSAFAQAALRALEPAEAGAWVRASGEWSAWHETGEPGCRDSLANGQRSPEHSMLGADLAAAGSGALWLAFLSERHDGGSGDFVRALWELARQRSKGLLPDDQLRGSPDLWEVIAGVLDSVEERWPDSVEEFGVARYFAGEPRRRAAAAFRVFASLPSDASVPLLADLDATQLPRRIRTDAEAGIEPLGSSYVRLRLAADPVCAAAAGCELRVWLRGELGPNWSLSAVRLDADGGELGRTRAPARNVPESYLPLALDAETHEVILVVTHLPRALPDADSAVPSPHGVELSLDRVATP